MSILYTTSMQNTTYHPNILFTGFGGSANKSSPLHTSPPPKRNNSPDGPSPAEPITDVSTSIL